MKKTLMLTIIMALGVTASVMTAPAEELNTETTAVDKVVERVYPPAEVTMARLKAAPWHELGYIEPDFDNDPMYQGNGDSDSSCSGDSGCGDGSCGGSDN